MTTITPFLWFDDNLEEALAFYTSVFEDAKVVDVSRTGPTPTDPVFSATFQIHGQEFHAINGGPHFHFTEAISLFVDCEDQAEVDTYWDKLLQAGATPTACGWIKDPFGISWQIVPRRFIELIRDRNPRKVKAVMEAMMTMVKLDVAALERAYNEA